MKNIHLRQIKPKSDFNYLSLLSMTMEGAAATTVMTRVEIIHLFRVLAFT